MKDQKQRKVMLTGNGMLSPMKQFAANAEMAEIGSGTESGRGGPNLNKKGISIPIIISPNTCRML